MSDMPLHPLADLVEDYALDMLEPAERARFEQALASDVALQRDLAATREALGALAFSTPVMPPANLRGRVMARVHATNASPASEASVIPITRVRRTSRAPIWLGAALAASLLLVAALALQLRQARAERLTLSALVATAERAGAARDSLLAQLIDPATELVNLAATGGQKPLVKAWINRSRRSMVLAAAQLDQLPADQAYQIWFIVDGKPIPSATFRPDSAGHALVEHLQLPAGTVGATAITREPAGGSSAPTTTPMFVGKLATE